MSLFGQMENWLVQWRYGAIRRHLQTAEPAKLIREGEQRALKAFHRAASTVPAYQRLLRQKNVDPGEIQTIEDFRNKVPIVNKEIVFAENELRDLCTGGLDGIAGFHSSSGQTGLFSFGVETKRNLRQTALAVEFALDNTFHILNRRTLIFNCLPMGVKLETRTVPVAETSVRADVVLELVNKLKNDFEQFVFVGEQLFLKRLFEQGVDEGIEWQSLVVHVVTGAEFVAENYRSYLGQLLGIDFARPETGTIGVNFGLSELSLSIMSENHQTLTMRRLAAENREFRQAIYPEGAEICPTIMQYYPQQCFLETVEGSDGKNELVVSMLDPSLRIPLIRYNTGDWVDLASYDQVAATLRQTGHESLIPPFKLPFGFAMGKRQALKDPDGCAIAPEHVKEALYHVPDIARRLTGNFLLQPTKSGVKLLIQTQRDTPPTEKIRQSIENSLSRYTRARTTIRLTAFEQFPHGLVQDFERKSRYVQQCPTDCPASACPSPTPVAHWHDEPQPVSPDISSPTT